MLRYKESETMGTPWNFKDLTGQRFGRLVVEKLDYKDRFGSVYWHCKCDCGNYTSVTTAGLKSGKNQSCGCISRERIIALSKARSTHGKTETRIYHIWQMMKQRCYNENKDNYEDYGGRGITVCEEWKNDFEAFYKWSMANGYTDKKTIDRIDVNGNYEPSNCRWATPKEQGNNRRSNRIIEYKGERKTMRQWADEKGISYNALCIRMKKGWSIEKALETPVRKKSQKKKP